MMTTIRFCEIKERVGEEPGYYEIHTDSGIALKVGIGVNLRKRLMQHRSSSQSCLKLKEGGNCCKPDDVISRQSILAKHLYYDHTLSSSYDLTLTTQDGRRQFLLKKCYIVFQTTKTKPEARELEIAREAQGQFRYVGRVTIK